MKKEPLRSENPRKSHLLNALSLASPFVRCLLLFGLAMCGDVVFAGDVDPYIAGTFVGLTAAFSGLALVAWGVRLVEYSRILRYLRQHGVLSYWNVWCDPLYADMRETKGRRKVLAAALTTLRRPAFAPLVLETFNTKGLPRYLPMSLGWLVATFSPARIR